MARPARVLIAAAATVLAGGLAGAPTEAHKPITSKYTYNQHVFPILRDQCGACHVEGGVAPMSLLTYRDARPWAESIREELMAERMPPHYTAGVEAAFETTGARHRPLTARELDTLIVWVTGGTPEGDIARRPPPVRARQAWPGGQPDLTLRMPAAVTVPAGRSDETRAIVLPAGLTAPRFVRAVDLQPGTPSMVRDATITVEDGPVLAVWVPGDDRLGGAPAGTAFRLEPGARLVLRMHYRKSWREVDRAIADRSSVGLYFTDGPAPPATIRSVAVDSAGSVVPAAMRVLAVRPQLDQPYSSVEILARTPNGTRLPLLRLRAPRPEWPRRYWLRQPIDLPAGTRIEIVGAPAEAFPLPAPVVRTPLAITLDVVSP